MNVVKELLKQPGIDINQAKNDGGTPLYIACQNGHVEVVNALLRFRSAEGQSRDGIDVNQATKIGRTPLFIACQKGHWDVVQMLIHAGANLNQGTKDGITPVEIAKRQGHTEIVKLLKKRIKMDVAKIFFKMHKQNDKKYVPPGVQGHIAGFLTGKYHQYVVGVDHITQ